MDLIASPARVAGETAGGEKPPLQFTTDRVKVAFRYAFILSAGLNLLALTSPLFMMQVYDPVLTGRHEETLFLLTVVAVAAYITFGVLDWVRMQVMMRAGAWAERQLSDATIVAGLRSTLAGRSLGAQGVQDLAAMRQVIGGRALFAFLDLPWALLFFAILFILNAWLGLYSVLCAMVIASLAIIGEKSARGHRKRYADRQAAVSRWVDQAVDQAEVVQALGMRENLLARHRTKMVDAHGENERSAARTESFAAAARAARQIAQVGIMALAALLLLRGDLSPGLIVGSTILLGRALAPIDILISSWQPTMTGWAAYLRLRHLLQTMDQSDANRTAPPPPGANLHLVDLHKRLAASPTGFLLRSISFSLRGGEALAIMGPSGSGKTSLCRILTGISVPEIGEIRLDGARLDQWPPDALGVHLGFLPQDVGLPPATVAETIARLAPLPDMDMVYRAAQATGAHKLILSLPQGYDTPIGAGGVPLSGGQRQRIGLARAIYGDPLLLVLDEPDAHLDTGGNRALVQTIEAAKARGAMVVVVSHRQTILRSIDRILVLKEGCQVFYGQRDEVLAKLRAKTSARPAMASMESDGAPV